MLSQRAITKYWTWNTRTARNIHKLEETELPNCVALFLRIVSVHTVFFPSRRAIPNIAIPWRRAAHIANRMGISVYVCWIVYFMMYEVWTYVYCIAYHHHSPLLFIWYVYICNIHIYVCMFVYPLDRPRFAVCMCTPLDMSDLRAFIGRTYKNTKRHGDR